jgi:hypothetical protein
MSYTNDEQRPQITAVEQEESISAKAKETGQSLKNLIASIGKKTRTVAQEKSMLLKEAAEERNIAASDAKDIQMLGSHIDSIITIFDTTMDKIGRHPYDEQQRLMVGLKKLLTEEIYVINASLNMAKRLKALEPAKVMEDPVENRVKERIEMNSIDAESITQPISPEVSELKGGAGFVTNQESEQT